MSSSLLVQKLPIDHDDGSLNGSLNNMEPTEEELEWIEEEILSHYSEASDKAIAAIAEHDHRVFAQWTHFFLSLADVLKVPEDILLDYAGELTAFGVDTRDDFLSPLLRDQDFENMGISVAHREIIANAIKKSK